MQIRVTITPGPLFPLSFISSTLPSLFGLSVFCFPMCLSMNPSICESVSGYFWKTKIYIFEGWSSSNGIINHDTMSDDKVVAADVSPRQLFFFRCHFLRPLSVDLPFFTAIFLIHLSCLSSWRPFPSGFFLSLLPSLLPSVLLFNSHAWLFNSLIWLYNSVAFQVKAFPEFGRERGSWSRWRGISVSVAAGARHGASQRQRRHSQEKLGGQEKGPRDTRSPCSVRVVTLLVSSLGFNMRFFNGLSFCIVITNSFLLSIRSCRKVMLFLTKWNSALVLFIVYSGLWNHGMVE